MSRGHPAASAPGIDWVERAAVGASALCLIHCIGLPLLLALLPALSSLIAIPERFHLWVLAFAVPTSALALAAGWRHHRHAYPLLVGAAGLTLLAIGALLLLGGRWETPVTIMGSLCLASAHIANWRLRHLHHHHQD
ncbi:MAG TPA: MerC domain-containing protein [Sphingomonas sp.]